MKAEKLKGHLDLLLLEVLRAGPAHGYVVVSALRSRSGGAFDLPEGTVYPALHRLEDNGWVTSTWATVEGRRRRLYTLTAAGRKVATAERRQWEQFSSAVNAVLFGSATGEVTA